SNEADEALELAAACEGLTWIHAETPAGEVDAINAELKDQGCAPEFENTTGADTDAYDEITERLKTEPNVAAMLYSLDPVIVDQGLATPAVATDNWPRSSVVAVAQDNDHAALAEDVTGRLAELDSEWATELLRGFHDSRRSVSDLDYEVDQAIRHWLAGQDLIDSDTATGNFAGTDQ